MLDYQINESICRAYLESVCGDKRTKRRDRFRGRRIGEATNIIPDTVSVPVDDYVNASEKMRKESLTPEERAREEREEKRLEKQRYLDDLENKRRSSQKYMVGSDSQVVPRTKEASLVPGGSDIRNPTISAAMETDPGMRLGKGAYEGLAYALPMVGTAAEISRGAEAAGTIADAAKKGTELADAAAKASTGYSRGGKIATRALKAYLPSSIGYHVGDELDELGLDKKWGNAARVAGVATGLPFLLKGKVPAKSPSAGRVITGGIAGGWGLSQAASDAANALEKRKIIGKKTSNFIDKTGDYVGFGVPLGVAFDASEPYIEKYAEKYLPKAIEKGLETPHVGDAIRWYLGRKFGKSLGEIGDDDNGEEKDSDSDNSDF